MRGPGAKETGGALLWRCALSVRPGGGVACGAVREMCLGVSAAGAVSAISRAHGRVPYASGCPCGNVPASYALLLSTAYSDVSSRRSAAAWQAMWCTAFPGRSMQDLLAHRPLLLMASARGDVGVRASDGTSGHLGPHRARLLWAARVRSLGTTTPMGVEAALGLRLAWQYGPCCSSCHRRGPGRPERFPACPDPVRRELPHLSAAPPREQRAGTAPVPEPPGSPAPDDAEPPAPARQALASAHQRRPTLVAPANGL